MNIEQIFNQIGINPVRAVWLMETLDLNTDNLSDPKVISRLEDIVSFMKNYDEDSQNFFIKKAVFGKQDKLKVLTEYIKLVEQKKIYEKISEEIENSKDEVFSSNDEFKIREIQNKESANNAKLSLLKEEIELYHK